MQISLTELVQELSNQNNLISNDFGDCPFVGRIAIIRTRSAGVFLGKIGSKNGTEVVLKNARRLWRWSGAASLSQLAVDGTSDPDNCKFPCEVEEMSLTEVIEIIPATTKAIDSIKGVAIWSA